MIRCEDCGKQVVGEPCSSSISIEDGGRIAVTTTVFAPFRWGTSTVWDTRGGVYQTRLYLRCEVCHEKGELARTAALADLARGPR